MTVLGREGEVNETRGRQYIWSSFWHAFGRNDHAWCNLISSENYCLRWGAIEALCRELAATMRRVPCWRSVPSRITTALPAPPRFRRWPRSGRTMRRVPCWCSVPCRMTTQAPRRAALQALAEKWPDDATRALLVQRAVQDDNEAPRRAALQALSEKWPDDATRALLAQRAVKDNDYDPAAPRFGRWPRSGADETTRALLVSVAVQDDNSDPRSAALQALAEKWPDDATRALLVRACRPG